MVMKKHYTNAGAKLLYLLRQQRYLYHQLKMVTARERQLAGTNSPEQLLKVIFGRRKLIEKLRDLDDKLRPIKANWQRLCRQIGPDHKSQAHKIVNQVQEIIGDILAIAPSGTAQSLPLNGNCRFDELFAETSP